MGRRLAQLITIQDMIPERLELREAAGRSQFAGRGSTMKGFRLEPLKTLEEKILYARAPWPRNP